MTRTLFWDVMRYVGTMAWLCFLCACAGTALFFVYQLAVAITVSMGMAP